MRRLVVEANKSKLGIDFRELWRYRDLFYILAYRDLRVRYAQTFLGLLWAVLQPLATLLIFTVVFGRAIKVDTGDIPYPLYALCGMAGWTYFGFVLNQSGNSIISSQEMIKKIYFPRLVIPLSKAVVGFIDFFIGIIFILCFLLYYKFSPGTELLYLPIFILLTIISALAIGIWLSALTIRYRDFQHIVPFLVQFGLYATPVGYPSSLIINNLPGWAIKLYFLNPMVGIVEGYRWCLLGTEPPSTYAIYSFIAVGLLFITSIFYFKRVERIMADIV